MAGGKSFYYQWSDIRSALAGSLGKPDPDRHDIEGWLTFQWNIIVGREIAAISRVDRISGKTLHVRIAGREWLSALKSLSKKIIQEINRQAGEELLSRILFKEGELVSSTPKMVSH